MWPDVRSPFSQDCVDVILTDLELSPSQSLPSDVKSGFSPEITCIYQKYLTNRFNSLLEIIAQIWSGD